MANINCILGIVVLLFTFYTWTEAVALRNSTAEQPDFTMSEKSELANKDLDGDTMTGDGESGAFRRVQRNADPCVYRGCKWPQYCDGNVYVPYVLDDSYSTDQKKLIVSSMLSISQYTCVQFLERRYQRDYLHIRNFRGCSSNVGRQGGAQDLNLEASKCLRTRTIQHELLHALGFHHEQSRSDRDQYVNVLWQNIKEGDKYNFKGENTVNLGTPYDYNSVMHYGRFAGSANGNPTLEAKNSLTQFGTATQMSETDIRRINLLYCSHP